MIPTGAGAAAPADEIEVLRRRDALMRIEHEWLALEARVDGAVFFQGAGWCRAVLDFETARANARFDPVVVLLRRAGRLVGVLPLERVRDPMSSALVPLGNGFVQYSDVLLDPEVAADAVVPRLVREGLAAAPADLVSFFKVREDSALKRGLPSGRLASGAPEGAPFVALSQFGDFAAYHGTIKPKTRKNMRNARNRLERVGKVTHEVATDNANICGIIERTVAGRARRLNDQGLTSRAFRDAGFAAFCRSLGECSYPGFSILAMSLRQNGAPLAEQWGFLHQGRYYAFVAARDFSLGEESPGKLHLKEVIETCFAKRIATADLLVPAMPYKLTWSTGVTPVQDYALPVTLRGRAIIHGWQRLIRPLAKRAFARLPARLRTTLMAMAAR